MLNFYLLALAGIAMLAFGIFRFVRGSRKVGEFIKNSKSKKLQP